MGKLASESKRASILWNKTRLILFVENDHPYTFTAFVALFFWVYLLPINVFVMKHVCSPEYVWKASHKRSCSTAVPITEQQKASVILNMRLRVLECSESHFSCYFMNLAVVSRLLPYECKPALETSLFLTFFVLWFFSWENCFTSTSIDFLQREKLCSALYTPINRDDSLLATDLVTLDPVFHQFGLEVPPSKLNQTVFNTLPLRLQLLLGWWATSSGVKIGSEVVVMFMLIGETREK